MTAMIRNYFKIVWRNLLKNRVYSSLNIVGLATGMAVALLIGLWIWDELSFNHYHKNHNRLAYVMSTQTYNGETETFPNIVVPLENELRTKYTGDFKRLSLTWNSTNILATGDKKISGAGKWAQPDLPEMLTLIMLKGISCLIAIPIAWYFLNQWLQNYNYRTQISWWIFAAAVAGALIITLLTVSFQAIKAAISNPVKSLRTE